jgi:hypothetical protein
VLANIENRSVVRSRGRFGRRFRFETTEGVPISGQERLAGESGFLEHREPAVKDGDGLADLDLLAILLAGAREHEVALPLRCELDTG